MQQDTESSERAKYEETWRMAHYRQVCHGLQVWKDYRHLFPRRPRSGLDIGSGTGRLVMQWKQEHIDAWGIDIASNAADQDAQPFTIQGNLWDPNLWVGPERASFSMGCCADVMEHIPPDRVLDVLKNNHKVCEVVVYKIANFPSVFQGRRLHLTLRPRHWWLEQLEIFGAVKEDLGRFGIEEYIFKVTSR